jgi:hypothetical protein
MDGVDLGCFRDLILILAHELACGHVAGIISIDDYPVFCLPEDGSLDSVSHHPKHVQDMTYCDSLGVPPTCCREGSAIAWCLLCIEDIRFIEWEDWCIFTVAATIVDLSRDWVLGPDLDGSFGGVSV